MDKRLKRCSTSTDVEATTEPSQNESDGSDDLEPQQILKKQKRVEKSYCVFENEDAYGNNARTILVRGLDCSLSTDDLKSALEKHFGSCGGISRVFVLTECKTASPVGVAYINLIGDEKKALLLDGTYLGSQKLEVVMARRENESVIDPSFKGCGRCHNNKLKRQHFNYSNGGRIQPRTPELDAWVAEFLQKAEAKKHM